MPRAPVFFAAQPSGKLRAESAGIVGSGRGKTGAVAVWQNRINNIRVGFRGIEKNYHDKRKNDLLK